MATVASNGQHNALHSHRVATGLELLALGAGLASELQRRRLRHQGGRDTRGESGHASPATGLLRTAAVGAGVSTTTAAVRILEQRLAERAARRLARALPDREALTEALAHALILAVFVAAGGIAARLWRDAN
jgi:hypothetical protein